MLKRKLNNQIDDYPIVLIPGTVLGNIENGIEDKYIYEYLNKFPPQKGQSSAQPIYPVDYELIESEHARFIDGSWFLIITSLFLSILIGVKIEESLVFIIGGFAFQIFICVILGYIRIENYQKIEKVIIPKEKYDRMLSDYYIKFKAWEKEQEDLNYNFNKEQASFNDYMSKNKREAILYVHHKDLCPDVYAQRHSTEVNRGKSELFFLKEALTMFRDLIYIDMSPLRLLNGAFYQPDYTFICPVTDLHIDIEIDEPYALKNQRPIHFYGSDTKRNEFFLGCNWCVIRFTESQAVNAPKECCMTIDSVYKAILNMKKEYTSYVDIESTWSYEEALIMSLNRTRDK